MKFLMDQLYNLDGSINYDPSKTKHGFVAGDRVRYVGVHQHLQGVEGICTGRDTAERVGVRYTKVVENHGKESGKSSRGTLLNRSEVTKEEGWLADSCQLIVTDDPGDPPLERWRIACDEDQIKDAYERGYKDGLGDACTDQDLQDAEDEGFRRGEELGHAAALNQWGHDSFELAQSKGFHFNQEANTAYHLNPTRIASRIALIHGELSEALEEVSRGRMELYYSDPRYGVTNPTAKHACQKPEGFGIELADVFLRLVDLAHSCGIDLDEMVRLKHEYNKTREIMHGGKKL